MTLQSTRAIHPIIIVGAGPAGIATAIELLKRGYGPEEIVVLEKTGEIANMIATKYPDEKPVLANYKERMAECLGDLCITDMSKADFLKYMRDVVEEKKININFHEQVESITQLHNHQLKVKTSHDTYIGDAVFVAIGNMSSPRTLGISVESDETEKIHYDLQRIGPELKKVLVVGGGDSAAEYAKILADRGHEVTLSYRGQDLVRMLDINRKNLQDLIEGHRLRFYPSSNLKSINQGLQVHFKESHYPPEVFDAVLTALGTERPTQYLSSLGIETYSEDQDSLFNEARIEGVFLVGDLASGKKGGSINFAFNSGTKAVAKACSLYLDCN